HPDVFVYIRSMEGRARIVFCKISALQDMKELQFHPLYVTAVQIVDRGEHHFLGLSGKIEDRVDDHGDIDAAETADGFVEYRQGIPAADIFRCFRMDRLKSKLDPDRFDPVDTVKQFKDIAAQTVRPCRNGQDFYI